MSNKLRYGLAPDTRAPQDWRRKANCLDQDPELFFPVGNTGPALEQIAEAKAICNECEVIDVCLQWALETGEDAGVWGGRSEDERRAIKNRRSGAVSRHAIKQTQEGV